MSDREHRIEDAVSVYLQRHPTEDRWVLDPATVDGGPLDQNYEFVNNANCTCGDEDACYATADRMDALDRPDAEQLMEMLADAYGYGLVKRP